MNKFKLALHLAAALIGVLATTSAMTQAAMETQGPTALSETYDAWTVQCANRQEGEQTQRTCQMNQELLQQETRQRVLMFAVGTAETGAKATMVLPFGLLLSEGVRVQLAEEEVLRGAFRTCLPGGCVVEIDLPEVVIQKFQVGETASVLMTTNSGQQMKTDISLKGFAPAYRRLSDLAAAPGK